MNSLATSSQWTYLLVRMGRFVLRRISMLFQYAYVLQLAAPLLLIKRTISMPFQLVLGHGAVLILSDRLVVKVASSMRSTVLVEYANAQRMSKASAKFSECTPSLRLIRGAVLTALVCERYQKVAATDVLDSAVEVREKFDSSGLNPRGASLDRYPQLRAGLEQLAQLFGEEVTSPMETLVRWYLAEGDYHTGLCHGDFHSRNIMRDHDGNVRVIDLDCVRFEGIVELDAVHFALELEWSASGVLWLDTLASAMESSGDNIAQCLCRFSVRWSEALGLVYFLDRVGQEKINYGFKYPKHKMQHAVAAIQRANDRTTNLELV